MRVCGRGGQCVCVDVVGPSRLRHWREVDMATFSCSEQCDVCGHEIEIGTYKSREVVCRTCYEEMKARVAELEEEIEDLKMEIQNMVDRRDA